MFRAQAAAQFGDLVADQGGPFVLEDGGGLHHLGLQFAQHAHDVVVFACRLGHAGRLVTRRGGVELQRLLVAAHDRARDDAVGFVVLDLPGAAVVGGGQELLDRAGDLVGEQDHLAVDVARRAARGLDQRGR